MSKYGNYFTTIFKGLTIGKMGDIPHHTTIIPDTEPHTRMTPKATCAGHRSGQIRDTEGRECWGGV